MIGFDKERSFYPVVLIVIATLYLLFAAMAKSTGSFVAEAIPALVFVAMAALGFRKTPWLVVAMRQEYASLVQCNPVFSVRGNSPLPKRNRFRGGFPNTMENSE